MKTKIFVTLIFTLVGLELFSQITWANTFTMGGINDDNSRDIIVDNNGNFYLIGSFTNTLDIDPGPGQTILTSMGGTDGFIAKYNSNGNLQWVNVYGSFYCDYGFRVHIDPFGNVFCSGYVEGVADLDAGPGTYTVSGRQYLIKLTPNGNTLWIYHAVQPWMGYGCQA